MELIERLERAQQQTWWLPHSVRVHQGPDHCFYRHGGRFNVVRFTPPPAELETRLNEILEVVGDEPAYFTFFPHRHGQGVLEALKGAGFVPGNRHEARVIHVERFARVPPADILVRKVETFEDMKRVYSVRRRAFGDGDEEPEESLRLYLKASAGPDARVPQFLAIDALRGEPLSQAGMSLFPDLNFSFLFAGATLDAARGRGAYTALVAARVDYARARGIEYVGLFAREQTSAPIVTRQGFERCGEMHYWVLNQP